MKEFFKKIITICLKNLTWLYLRLNKVEVIAITGSVGKTTAKTALSQFLKDIDIYVPEEGYNTEIGVPLTVFKEKVPENTTGLFAWLKILFRMIAKLFKRAPYKRIVLEMGADRPGDIKFLTSFIKPKVAIVTNVKTVHIKDFKTIQNVAREKSYLVEAVGKSGLVVLNIDDKYVRLMGERTRAKKIWIGEDKKADLRWQNVVFKKEGINFELIIRNQTYKVRTNFLAPQLLTSLFSAFAVGLYFNIEVRDLINRLEKFRPEKGRMSILKGINNSLIIDDSYNASLSPMLSALDVLRNMPKERKIAVIGSMRELGGQEIKAHQEVSKKVAEIAEVLVTVGEVANKYIPIEFEKTKKKKVKRFTNAKEAGKYLTTIVKDGDVMLFKGSQNTIFMEEAVKEVMAEPAKADQLLVRQSKMWEDKKAFMEEK